MDPLAIFGLSVLMSLISSIVAATLLVSPWLRAKSRRKALLWLVTPHMFLRFIGLSFLVPGVVSESLPKAMAIPAAYGDCVAGILAIVAVAALARTASWAIVAVWIFNVLGRGRFPVCVLPRRTRATRARLVGRELLYRDGNRPAAFGFSRPHFPRVKTFRVVSQPQTDKRSGSPNRR